MDIKYTKKGDNYYLVIDENNLSELESLGFEVPLHIKKEFEYDSIIKKMANVGNIERHFKINDTAIIKRYPKT